MSSWYTVLPKAFFMVEYCVTNMIDAQIIEVSVGRITTKHTFLSDVYHILIIYIVQCIHFG
jgi:hypothetical protein